ncbi:NAD-dependent epimerase/dehydratase family protein [Natronorarus salvus]|uniref:NAD-dependent epimerase/dehydratase family protein n=1 Tax=Natronorarus salvus TaxID=3117733 RepID=UPI002F266550
MIEHGPRGTSVLVTGGAGFIGSHLAEALCAENEVRVVDDLSSGRATNLVGEATLVEGDIRDEAVLREAIEDVDLVFHQAALASVPLSVEDPKESHAVNATATLSLLELAREEDCRVVLASSPAIYGEPEELPIAEDHPTRPTSPYGLDKLALDRYATIYNDLYGVETVVLRYFNAYGPRQADSTYSAVISAFLEQARSGGPITVHGDGEQTRDFVHVSDVVRANLLAAGTDHVGEAFNVGTGVATRVRDLAELVREATGSGAEITHTDARQGDIVHSRADATRARERLGFEATVTLDEGIRDLCRAVEAADD